MLFWSYCYEFPFSFVYCVDSGYYADRSEIVIGCSGDLGPNCPLSWFCGVGVARDAVVELVFVSDELVWVSDPFGIGSAFASY